MKILRYSTQYRKDFKRYRNQPEKLQKLLEVLRLLENEEELPKELRAHKLIGQYKDCMECHIEGDFLLIWLDENSDVIEIVRIGSHSELFK
jgi:mRNA interferase YafQ